MGYRWSGAISDDHNSVLSRRDGNSLVYDVTDEQSFKNVKNWMSQIEQHAADNVNKVLVANKCDVDASERVVDEATGKALAEEFGIDFYETSAKSNINVEDAFTSIASKIMKRLMASPSQASPRASNVQLSDTPRQKGGCC